MFPTATVDILAPRLIAPVAALAGVRLAGLNAREVGVLGVEAIVDGGEQAQNVIQLCIHGRRIGRSARHGGRCIRRGLQYQIVMT